MIHPTNFICSPLFTILFGLALGSFFHAIAHRIAFQKEIFRKRSHCPTCDTMIAWYQNIPVLSWLLLGGKCYTCKNPISWVYPITELITAIGFFLIWHYMPLTSITSGIAYSFFFSALVIASACDLHSMTIPQITSLWLAPIGLCCAFFSLLSITFKESLMGGLIGYGSLWTINYLFKKIKKVDGIGEGDMELFCMIGTFIGALGLWHTLLIASLTGSLAGGLNALMKKNTSAPFPFGPFLALGSLAHLFFYQQIKELFLLL